MQTPLAICQNRLEALLETNLQEEQLCEIIKTQQTIDYMSKLNKALLLLSKIENQQFSEVARVDFNEIVDSLISDFKDVYSSQCTNINVVSNMTLVVDMNIILAKTLIINLIKNAFVHNTKNGEVNIYIDKSTFMIENSGNQELDESQIFNRFYQGKKQNNSTGLGLAIVYSICKENNFGLKYKFVNNMHQFHILF